QEIFSITTLSYNIPGGAVNLPAMNSLSGPAGRLHGLNGAVAGGPHNLEDALDFFRRLVANKAGPSDIVINRAGPAQLGPHVEQNEIAGADRRGAFAAGLVMRIS